MRIGFDAKRAVQNNTGLGNYSRFIVDILSRFYPSNEYVLYAPKPRENKSLNAILQRTNTRIAYPQSTVWKKFASIWRVWGIGKQLREDKLDLYHGLSNELPLSIKKSDTKSIVTIHDLIFLRYPQFYKWIDRRIYAYKFRKACENCNRVIAISEMTKRDIIDYFHIEKEKIDVVYQGCDSVFRSPVAEETKADVRRKYNLPSRYILNVGSIESRKNLLLIVKALKHVPQDISLVAVGKRTPYTDSVEKYIEENGLGGRVLILNKVPFGDLPAIYQNASLFVYPSFFEGFGIPIIEAIHSGLPVIAATGSCLEEAGGPGSIYVNPDDEQELAEKISLVLSSPELAAKMIAEGKEYVKRFSDEAIAKDVMAVYNKLHL